MTRPTKAEILLPALRRNLALISERASAGGSCQVIAVVKADAYGHGALPVARTLLASGVRWLAVACLEEAVELLDAGISPAGGVILMGPLRRDEMDEVAGRGLVAVVSGEEDLAVLLESGAESLRVIVKVDTGMGRTGFFPEDIGKVCEALRSVPGLRLAGIFSHLPSADSLDEDDRDFTRSQLVDFQLVTRSLERVFGPVELKSIANSGGLFYHDGFTLSAVRPGVTLYGVRPQFETPDPAGLWPVMRWVTEIAQVRGLPAGASVSYGRRTVLKRASRIALLPVGYADGLRRALSPGFAFAVRGAMAPVVGVITMDYTMLDVTDVDGASVGDRVLLMGRERAAPWRGDSAVEVLCEDHARAAGTIPYEILTSVGPRVRRVYLEEE